MSAATSAASAGLHRYCAISISDLHLGTRGCRSDFLADILRRTSSEKLYLVGDIIEGWRLRKSWYWDAAHDEVLKLILCKARNGTEVTYIPGNHDELFRTWLPMGLDVCGIRLRSEAVHETADRRRLLIMHGNEFDSVVRYPKFLARWAIAPAPRRSRRTGGSIRYVAASATLTGRCPPG